MMKTRSWRIEPARRSQIARLAQLHHDALPNDFLPSLGQDFLESVYYPAALNSAHGITLVATVADAPVGFVTVAHDADRFMGGVIRQACISTSYYIARGIVRRPRMFVEVLGLTRTMAGPPDEVRGEIAFIAVDASQRGGGIGTALVRSALDYLAERQVSRCRTKTLAANAGVIDMYRRLGWNVRDRFWLIGHEYATVVSPPIGCEPH